MAARLYPVVLIYLTVCVAGQSSGPDLTYRWVYRNPLSIIAALAGARDRGMGSYYGTVNSEDNSVPDVPQIGLQYNHGASLTRLPNDSLASVWQASVHYWEGAQDQSVYWALSDDDGQTWGAPVKVYQNTTAGGGPLWCPKITVVDDTLYLFISGIAPNSCEQDSNPLGGSAWPPGGSLVLVNSTDNGETWSDVQVILSAESEGGIAKLQIAGVTVTPSGNWILPFWREASGPDQGRCWNGRDNPFQGVPGVMTSSDQGRSWDKTTVAIKPARGTPSISWLIENAIAPWEDQSNHSTGLLQIFRDKSGYVWQSTSTDEGATWSNARPGALIAPDSKADLCTLPGGIVVVAYNNATDNMRQNLTLAVTIDGGDTWQRVAVIETNTSYSPPSGKFSYPALFCDNSTITVAYSVGFPPDDRNLALLAQAQALSPGIFFPHINNSAPVVAPKQRRAAASSPSRGNPNSRSTNAGRRLSEADLVAAALPGHARGLKQEPYDKGPFKLISYGIRVAYLDAEIAYQVANTTLAQRKSAALVAG